MVQITNYVLKVLFAVKNNFNIIWIQGHLCNNITSFQQQKLNFSVHYCQTKRATKFNQLRTIGSYSCKNYYKSKRVTQSRTVCLLSLCVLCKEIQLALFNVCPDALICKYITYRLYDIILSSLRVFPSWDGIYKKESKCNYQLFICKQQQQNEAMHLFEKNLHI